MLSQKTYNFFALFGAIFAFLPFAFALAAMSGGSYELYADTFSTTEDGGSIGGTYSLTGTTGEFGASPISGDTYELRGGFQAMERGVLTLSFTDTSLELGTLSLTAVASTTVSSTISTDSITGYSLTFDEDGNLSSDVADIDDVADGEVTLGNEEYGVVTVGGGGELDVDTAIVDGLLLAGSDGAVVDEETGIIFKAAIGGNSRAGDYSQTLTATLSVNP